MPARNRVPSFQIASGTANERDNSYNIPTGSIFFNTDTSNIELSGNVVVAGDISATNVVLSGNAVVNGVVISNGTPSSNTDLITKGYADAEYVNDTTAQTIAGVKTFSSVPKTAATPSASTDLIPNWYARSVYGNTNVYVQTNTGGHNIGTNWSLIYTFGSFTYTSNCKIGINYSVPVRNNTQSWGGIHTEIYYSLNGVNGTYRSLGQTGHVNVMTNAGATIDIVNLNYLLDLTAFSSGGTLHIRAYHRAYSGAAEINTNQQQTQGSSYSYIDKYQNYAKVIVNVYGY